MGGGEGGTQLIVYCSLYHYYGPRLYLMLSTHLVLGKPLQQIFNISFSCGNRLATFSRLLI